MRAEAGGPEADTENLSGQIGAKSSVGPRRRLRAGAGQPRMSGQMRAFTELIGFKDVWEFEKRDAQTR